MTTASTRHPRWRALRDGLLLYLAVALGTAIGGVARTLISLAALETTGHGFPWATLAVNVVGSFIIGFYATLSAPDGRLFVGARQRHFVMTGICGGFTTFSVFSLETLRFAADGLYWMGSVYVGLSLVTWLAAAWLGHALATRINRLRGT